MFLSQIFNQSPAERRAFMQQQGEPTHRATIAPQEARDMNAATPRPPAAHTHRGRPRDFALQGHHEGTRPDRTPTHHKPGPAVVPAKFAHLAIARETRYA